jgi:DNA-binding response OmpR family regulator
MSERPRVLVVDDEKEVADGYALRLRGAYESDAVYGGEPALDRLDGERYHVVLLDRRMPELSGDDVLARIRERELRCRVVMMTAVDPGFGIVDMPFDDYLCKPVDRESLRTAVDGQCRILAYQYLSDYFRLESKCSVIETKEPAATLETDERYADLRAEADRLREEVTTLVDDADDLLASFEAVDRGL